MKMPDSPFPVPFCPLYPPPVMQLEDLQSLTQQALSEIEAAPSADALEILRVQYLGRKGKLPEIMASLKDVAPEDRPAFGQGANAFKVQVTGAIQSRKDTLLSTATPADALDVTLPGNSGQTGSLRA